jgi:hypothetical protein
MVAEQPVSADASIAVVFLARGVDGGLKAARLFLDSYRAHPVNTPHRLYLIAKGWADRNAYRELCELAAQHAATIIDLPDDGFDWGAYFRAAPIIAEQCLCFFNTHSVILADGWLDIMREAAGDGIGAVGCTASYGTMAPVFSFIGPMAGSIGYHRGWLKGLIAWRGVFTFPLRFLQARKSFPPFPNPHLRSNAFLVRNALFQSYASARTIPRSKRDAFLLESGYPGFTLFLKKSGLEAVVVGTDRKSYDEEEWLHSQTFRVPGQRNLLVSDNQTRNYDASEPGVRRIMELTAWGRFLSDPAKKKPPG